MSPTDLPPPAIVTNGTASAPATPGPIVWADPTREAAFQGWLTRVAAAPVNGRNLSLLTTGEDVVAVAAVRPDGVRLDYRRLPDTLDDGRPLFIASVPEVAALPTDRAGSTVQAAVTFRDGTTIVVPVSIPELFRRTP